jgi:hypothetical protein
VVVLGLSSCIFILRPIGVAALSKPKPLAAKFRVISPSGGRVALQAITLAEQRADSAPAIHQAGTLDDA